MAYSGKTNWRPNTPVTEDDFNRIEQGITDAHDNIDEHTEKDAPHSGHEKTANKARPGGYASLDSGGNVPGDQLGNLPDNLETETGAQDKVDEHASRTNNPHNVTATQAGAPTTTAFNNHVNDTSNPHNVTTEQIGAETPQGAQDKADAAEANAKTYAEQQVGAIPEPTWENVTGKPTVYPPEDHTHSVTDVTGLQSELDSKETISGAQDKADAAEANAKDYTDQEVSLVAASAVPSGVITMWTGTTAPNGWALCNGENGTPDLRDKFVVGAGGSYESGDTGGEDSVTLTESQMPSHDHGSGTLSTGSAGSHSHGSGSYKTSTTGSHTHSSGSYDTDSSGSHSHGSGTLSTDSSGSHNHSLTTKSGSGDSGSRVIGTERYGTETSRYTNTSGSHSHSVSGRTDSGGSHSHDVAGYSGSSGSHSHNVSGNSSSSGTHSHSISGTTSNSGGGQSHENRPPYYALAYIMKL